MADEIVLHGTIASHKQTKQGNSTRIWLGGYPIPVDLPDLRNSGLNLGDKLQIVIQREREVLPTKE